MRCWVTVGLVCVFLLVSSTCVLAEAPSAAHTKLVQIFDNLEKSYPGFTEDEITTIVQDVTYNLSEMANSDAAYCGVPEKILGARLSLKIAGVILHRHGRPSQAKVICAPVKGVYESLGTPAGAAMAYATQLQVDALNAMFDGIRLDRDEGWGSGLTAPDPTDALPDDMDNGMPPISEGVDDPDTAPPPVVTDPEPPPPVVTDPEPPVVVVDPVPPPVDPRLDPLPPDVEGGSTPVR